MHGVRHQVAENRPTAFPCLRLETSRCHKCVAPVPTSGAAVSEKQVEQQSVQIAEQKLHRIGTSAAALAMPHRGEAWPMADPATCSRLRSSFIGGAGASHSCPCLPCRLVDRLPRSVDPSACRSSPPHRAGSASRFATLPLSAGSRKEKVAARRLDHYGEWGRVGARGDGAGRAESAARRCVTGTM